MFIFKGIYISCWKWKTRQIQMPCPPWCCSSFVRIRGRWKNCVHAWDENWRVDYSQNQAVITKKLVLPNLTLLVISDINNTPKNVQTRFWWSKEKAQTYGQIKSTTHKCLYCWNYTQFSYLPFYWKIEHRNAIGIAAEFSLQINCLLEQ